MNSSIKMRSSITVSVRKTCSELRLTTDWRRGVMQSTASNASRKSSGSTDSPYSLQTVMRKSSISTITSNKRSGEEC
ncbi:hypothetical protein LJK88_40340 [Paenibacillus sp. P26]|nr:hypothetical protein LJK88_40340 [Paenibacillus sp. P26]